MGKEFCGESHRGRRGAQEDGALDSPEAGGDEGKGSGEE